MMHNDRWQRSRAKIPVAAATLPILNAVRTSHPAIEFFSLRSKGENPLFNRERREKGRTKDRTAYTKHKQSKQRIARCGCACLARASAHVAFNAWWSHISHHRV